MLVKLVVYSMLLLSLNGLHSYADNNACQSFSSIESVCRKKLTTFHDECPPLDCAAEELASAEGIAVYALSTYEEDCEYDCKGNGILGKPLYRLTDDNGEIISACYRPASTRIVGTTLLIAANNNLWPVQKVQTAHFNWQIHDETVTDIEITSANQIAWTVHTHHEEYEPDDSSFSGAVVTESTKRFYFWLTDDGPLSQHQIELYNYRENNTSPTNYEGETSEEFDQRLVEWQNTQTEQTQEKPQPEAAPSAKDLPSCSEDHSCPSACVEF